MLEDKFYNELEYYYGGHKDAKSMLTLALEYINEIEEDREQLRQQIDLLHELEEERDLYEL